MPSPTAIADLVPSPSVSIRGKIVGRKKSSSRRRTGGHLKTEIADATGSIACHFFNQGWLFDALAPGQEVWVNGSVKSDGFKKAIVATMHRRYAENDSAASPVVCPEYPTVTDVKPGIVAKLARAAAERVADRSIDPLPQDLVSFRGLPAWTEFLRMGHAPVDMVEVLRFERRRLYHGFLATALDVECGRRVRTQDPAPECRADDRTFERAIGSLPFTPTRGQAAAIDVVRRDLESSRPMRRLLQGDVGSGKTVVAVLAARLAAAAGFQTAILAPTEILARQLHAAVASMGGQDDRPDLLVGGMPTAERRALLGRLRSGETKIVVGTQALLLKSVAFDSLGLVVVDEQHRFGVLQRLTLVRKGLTPHLLVMSATPIPRTLALTICGDLELTEIRERPLGRATIETRVFDGGIEKFPWQTTAARARNGKKIFIVFPAIDAEDVRCPSLLREGREIAKKFFRGIPVKGLHGRMPEADKISALDEFRSGSARVLFSTTVIEVGIDVPDAEEIVIVGAERFGAAQLHQLRGRIGRGKLPGTCIFLTSSETGENDRERVLRLAKSDDGFAIAELDLELRGPGDIMGLRQHGLGFFLPGADERELLLGAFADARRLLEGRVENLPSAETLRKWSRRSRALSADYRDSG